jgi:hypothetical protein
MAEQDKTKKPPAITVRCESWEDYEWITQAAAKREMSRGEFLLAGTLQRRTGGPMPKSRAAKRAATARVATSAEAKAGVKPIPRKVPTPGTSAATGGKS